ETGLQVLRTGDELPRSLRAIRLDSGHNDNELTSPRIQKPGNNCVVLCSSAVRIDFRVPSPSLRAFFPYERLGVLTDEAEVKTGRHLHRPAIVEGSNDDGRRVSQVFERVVAPNSHLILFSDLAEKRREPNRRVHIPSCDSIVG